MRGHLRRQDRIESAGLVTEVDVAVATLPLPSHSLAHLEADALRARAEWVRGRAARARYRPRVAWVCSLDPPRLASEVEVLVGLAGGQIATPEGGASDEERLLAMLPEVVIVSAAAADFERSARALPAFFAAPRWRALPAVRDGRVYAVEGLVADSRDALAWVSTLEHLAGLVQPGLCGARLAGVRYLRLGESSLVG